MSSSEPAVSVVIATRDRVDLLRDCVAALTATDADLEVIVVDDATSGLDLGALFDDPRVRALRAGGIGTSAARNLGIEAARAAVVAFTDDDTVPAAGWAPAVAAALEADPAAVGVEGPVVSDPWDPLYAHSIEADAPGNYWTANVAYRTALLRELGGFDAERFPVYGEDRDLALRMLARGPIAWAPGMSVVHRARTMALRDFRVPPGRTHADFVLLTREHPDRVRWHRLRLLAWTARRWWRLRALPAGTRRSPARELRWLAVGMVRLGTTARGSRRVPPWVHEAWRRVAAGAPR